jgi:glycosyltransferase involved in cell wall biosynthesis
MKVLIFNWKDIKHPNAGGAEVLTIENAKRFVEKGWEVTWFTSAFEGCKKEEEIDGVKIVRAGNKYTVYSEARKYYKNQFFGKFDVVIDETNTRPFFAKDFVKDAKVIFLIHQLAKEWWFYETKFPMNFLGYFLEPFWLKSYSSYPTVTVSESTKQDLERLGFMNVSIISEGISFKPFSKLPEKSSKPSIVYLGRLNKGKRVLLALEAFKQINDGETEFWIVGDGYIRREIEKRKVEGVKLFGKVSEEQKIDILSKAWLHVNPSIREGWGINVIEANACGTPTVAFDVPGLRDSVVDGYTGLLVKEQSKEALAEAMLKVLKDERLRLKLSRNSLKWARRFSWDKSAREFMRVIEGVVNG